MALTDDTPPPTNPLALLGGLLGAAGGFALSRYAGANLLIPGVVTVVLLLVFAKTPLGPRHFRGAIAVTGAHTAWFVAGALLTGQSGEVLADIVLLALGAGLLWVRPSLWTALFLGAVQGLSLAFNVHLLLDAALSSPAHRALSVHVLLRVLVLGLLVLELRVLRAKQAAAVAPVEAAP